MPDEPDDDALEDDPPYEAKYSPDGKMRIWPTEPAGIHIDRGCYDRLVLLAETAGMKKEEYLERLIRYAARLRLTKL